LVVLGINPSDPVTRLPELESNRPKLAIPDTVLIDRLSRPEVGPREVGLVTQVGPSNLEVVGQFSIGSGFEAGLLVVSDQTFSRLFAGLSLRQVNLGLVKLRPGVDAARAAAELNQQLPQDVRVMTRAQLKAAEERYWVVNTSTGIIFGSGVIVAALFGLVITYQVLSLEVAHRQSEYATLKALGFSDGFLSMVVLQQAGLFAVLSFVPGFAVAQGIYYLCATVTKLPIYMTWERTAVVLCLTLAMCALSGLRALRHLRRADPVDLFA
jgi:putative ABC transport system permease protein